MNHQPCHLLCLCLPLTRSCCFMCRFVNRGSRDRTGFDTEDLVWLLARLPRQDTHGILFHSFHLSLLLQHLTPIPMLEL
ncbi:uncharacterized protein BP01DRAFT_169809 [Aspergillus saccharolyticus JOP 1030-1]|uniref:Secreted protein n=1 Tax=Aspergillus saccharolyticus JOP 1030-1 TaxID=1450539 RepID=A0A318ZCT8_9EURO|nr:hypothetical protein BP01DRAFT_169809 [Aspergillus saccharolyticus JOP 1030-1]PYH41340.1 hypothetical protein BP01DRAFT_169809 [Aspergillus saccharolyticus JOP 1030-1]